MIVGLSIDGRQVTAKLKLIAEDSRILRNVGVKIAGTLGEPATAGSPEGIDVSEIELAVVAVALIFDQIHVHVDAICSHHGRAAL